MNISFRVAREAKASTKSTAKAARALPAVVGQVEVEVEVESEVFGRYDATSLRARQRRLWVFSR